MSQKRVKMRKIRHKKDRTYGGGGEAPLAIDALLDAPTHLFKDVTSQCRAHEMALLPILPKNEHHQHA